MNKNLKDMTVSENDTVKEILIKINRNGYNGVFMVSKNNKLLGVITDSDIRKNLLKNEPLWCISVVFGPKNVSAISLTPQEMYYTDQQQIHA